MNTTPRLGVRGDRQHPDQPRPRPIRRGGSFGVKQGCLRQVESEEWRVKSCQRRVPGAGKRLVTWLHSVNGCAKINKMLNVSIQSLSTIHSSLFT